MAKFYLMGNYTAKAFQGFIANPDTDRGAAIKAPWISKGFINRIAN